MNQRIWFTAAAICAYGLAQAEDVKGGLNDFLADTSGSYVGAAGIIDLDGKVMRDTSSPKEFVASINTIRRKDAKDGVGVAFTPGRARFEKLVVGMGALHGDYKEAKKRLDEKVAKEGRLVTGEEEGSLDRLALSPGRRLWGATTFSYAKKRGDVGTLGEHRFWSYAVNTEYYWNYRDDPAVAAYRVFIGDGKTGSAEDPAICAKARSLSGQDASKLQDGLKQLRLWQTESAVALAKAEANAAQKEKEADDAEKKAAEAKKLNGADHPDTKKAAAAAEAASAANGKARTRKLEAEKEKGRAPNVAEEVTNCINAASKAAVDKWNAPKLTLLWGQGYIQSTAAASSRYSLGNHLQLAASISPGHWSEKKEKDNYLKNGLLTVSYKRSTNAVDTTTLAGTPVFNSQSLLAARYTHAFGGKEDSPIAKAGSTDGGINTYVLAEFSTAKSNTGGVAAGTYKQALGVDYRLGANMWLELRHGRAVAQTGDKYETKSMLTLKLSPETALAALMPKP